MKTASLFPIQFGRIGLIAGVLAFGWIEPSSAQWNDPVTNTPSLVQTNFGPYGDLLPGNGEAYCGPTAITMDLYWAASNGFTQLAPASYNPNSPTDQAAALNLELTIAGLSGSSPNTGTYDTGISAGVATYFAAKGISTSQFTTSIAPISDSSPLILNWLSANMAGNQIANPTTLTFQQFTVAWFYTLTPTGTTFYSDGGHFLDPMAVDLANSTVTVNNPYPAAFLNVPNEPASNPQTVGVTQLPAGYDLQGFTNPSNSQDYSQIQAPFLQNAPSQNSTFLGDNSTNKAVIDDAQAWSIDISALPSSSGYTINPWEIDSAQTINTNGATFSVIAPVHGAGGFIKTGLGELILTNTNDLTGLNTVQSGTMTSTVTSGTPFGRGSLALEGDSTLQVQPDDTTPADIDLHIASGSGSQFILDNGGGTLLLTKGNNTSLTVTLGGNTDGTTGNITRAHFGTLVIAPDAGLAALGDTIKVKVAGTSGNLPAVINGIVTPHIMGQNNDANRSGAFLNYSNTDGFIQASAVLSSDVGINDASITGTTVYDINNAQSITGGDIVSVYALQVDGTTLGESVPGSTINVGSQSSADTAGVILNGGTISASNMEFGAAEAAIYTNLANGTINSQINGSGGMTKLGPGMLTITSNNLPSLTGNISVNEGTLVAASTTGSPTGTGTVTVYSNATLKVNSGATVAGTVNVNNSGTVYLNGGTITGSVTTAAIGSYTSQPGGTLEGHGVIAGNATIGSAIKAGPETAGIIEFTSSVDLQGAEFIWQLNSLVDNTTSSAGIGWNALQFDQYSVISNTSNPLSLYLDFSLVDGPESTDTFWNTTHDWTIMNFPNGLGRDFSDGNFDFQNGTFSRTGINGDTALELVWTPIAVPESSTWVLLAGGCLVCALMRRIYFIL